MRLAAAFSLLTDLRFAIKTAFFPTLNAILRSPSILLSPMAVSRLFMAEVWENFGQLVDEGGRSVKEGLIPPNAYGVVLDLGAGHGHTMKYLDHSRVTKYIALEPNVLMHPHIRSLAKSLGYTESDGRLQILSCGAEDITSYVPRESVDTLVSILTLCTVPDLPGTLNGLIVTLKPGSLFLFYEHVLSPRADVRWWQKFWTPMWSTAFDGCRLDRATDKVVRELGGEGGIWKEEETWGKNGEKVDECLFWHQVGRFVKA